ncbi:MAG: glycosyltransferase family 2 protein [Candidatus Sumerlaeaceae bacterium]
MHLDTKSPLVEGGLGTPPAVSVIIVNYQTSGFVRRCVRSLCCQDVPLEIIVVDNASPNDDWQSLLDLPILLVRNAENLGYGKGCNLGAQQAQAPLLCVLNPDTVVPPEAMRAWLQSLARLQSEGVRVGVLAPVLCNDNGTIQRSTYRFPGALTYWLNHSLLAGFLKRLRKSYGLPSLSTGVSKPRAAEWVMGSAMLIPRAAWDDVGGFSSAYFLYAEDTDLCFRLRKAGYEIIQDPQISIIHTQGEPTAEVRALAIQQFFSALETFLSRNYPRWRRVTVRCSMLGDLSLRMLFLAGAHIVGLRNRHNRERMRAYRKVWQEIIGRLWA